MDLRQLRYFTTVAEAGSLGAAARRLAVTQPALTTSMQRLEADLGTQLLRRRGGGVELTAAGQLLYDEGAALLGQLGSLEERVRSFGRTESETIRVGLTVLFSMQLMQQIARFIASHRNVAVTLVQDGSRELQRRLVSGDIDLAVLSFPQVEPDIEMEAVRGTHAGYDVAVVLPADHPLAGRDELSFSDLADESWSTFSTNFVLGHLLAREVRPTPNIVLVNDDWEVLLASVRNLGTACLLPAAFEELTTQTGLAWRPLNDRANRFPVGLATRRGQAYSPALAELIGLLRAA